MIDIPRHWKWSSLSSLASSGLMTDGDWVESKDQDPQGMVRLVQLADIGEGVFLNRSSRFLTMAKAKELRCTFLEPGDVLIARMPDPLGRACVFPGLSQPAVTAVDVCIVRPGPNGPDPSWLTYFVNSPQIRERIASAASGTTRQRISGGNLKTIELPTPPIDEQVRIAKKLDHLLGYTKAAREELVRATQLSVRYKEAVLERAFTGKLTVDSRQTGESPQQYDGRRAIGIDGRIANLYSLPPTWTWSSVGSVAEVAGGLTKNAQRGALPLKVPYLRVANVYANELRLDDVAEIGCTPGEYARSRLAPGDLLVVEGNGSIDQIGRVAMWNGEIDGCSHQNHLIRVRPGMSLVPQYALHWLLSPFGRAEIEQVASSSSGLHTLSISKVEGLAIPMCSVDEQREIVQRIDAAFARANGMAGETRRAGSLAARLDQAVLSRAFRGELAA